MKYLYLIVCQNLYKIGVASDVFNRLAALQTGNPFPLRIAECYEFSNSEVIEKALHQKFSNRRKRGEWFDLSQKDLLVLEKLCLLLGGKRVEIKDTANEEEIAIAEEQQEVISEYRMEKRYNSSTGEIRGFVFRSRDSGREILKYVGKRNRKEFQELLAKEESNDETP